MSRSVKLLTIILPSLFLGLLSGHYFWPRVSRGVIVRDMDSQYNLINPILTCEVAPEDTTFPELSSLRTGLKDIANKAKSERKLESVDVYFRGLQSGRWIEFGDQDNYAPASLLKVLTAIAHLRLEEINPGHLKQVVQYTEQTDIGGLENNVEETSQIKLGQWYTIRELLERLLAYSDNQSNNLLIDNVDSTELAETYSNLGISMSDSAPAVLNPKTYSLLFRVLYNATYLSRANSEEILQMMTKSNFRDGLVAGLPDKLPVAHKFGARTLAREENTESRVELHDCGIVYYPEHPYFLCVMTRGYDYNDLGGVIAEVSRAAYRWQDDFWTKR